MKVLCVICSLLVTGSLKVGVEELKKLEPVWIFKALANTQIIGPTWQRYCISQLFRRHVSPGMKLSELARLLDNSLAG
jgi:hypothetical protein